MAKSPPPGTSSSNNLRPLAEACAALGAFIAASPIAPIVGALAPSAQLHLVGGTVRDALLGHTPADFDLCTVLSAAEVLARLNSANNASVATEKTIQRVIRIEHAPRNLENPPKGSPPRETHATGRR
ncbi:MAG: hypothetical protein EBZ48_15535 [Proteobacteria bacterium]|nr:hypothetical protein [Pseudomonadota bacterium]